MKYRKLRIAWSVAWGVLAVLLCVLWVRSYWWVEQVVQINAHDELIGVGANSGGFELHFGQLPVRYWDLSAWHHFTFAPFSTSPTSIGFVPTDFVGITTITIPAWTIVPAVATIAALPWFRLRFSLRTLLVATTLIALALGIIVWVSRAD